MSSIEFDFARTIQANPGFFVLHALSDDNGYPTDVDQASILAWAFEVDSLVPYPVTLEGVRTDNAYILQPHGAVERTNIDGFASVADWLKSQQDDYAKKHGGPK